MVATMSSKEPVKYNDVEGASVVVQDAKMKFYDADGDGKLNGTYYFRFEKS